jgi:hypothetical protein
MTETEPTAPAPPSRKKLLLGTGAALAIAAVGLVVFVLPAEYGIDPTGAGAALGLTQLSDGGAENIYLKRGQARTNVLFPTEGAATPDEETLRKLLAEKGAAFPRARNSGPTASRSSCSRTKRSSSNTCSIRARRCGSRGRPAGRSTVDMHSHPFDGGPRRPRASSCRPANQTAVYVAPFNGIHGWYWQNRTMQPVTLTLDAVGLMTGSKIFDRPASTIGRCPRRAAEDDPRRILRALITRCTFRILSTSIHFGPCCAREFSARLRAGRTGERASANGHRGECGVGNPPRGASYRRLGLGRITRSLIPACAALALGGLRADTRRGQRQQRADAGRIFDYLGWDAYLGGSDSSQFSALDQINRANVNQLEVAWTYETGAGQPPMFNPTIANGMMYVTTGDGKIAALDPATGRELWKSETTGRISGRGVNYWQSKDGSDRRLVFLNDGAVRAIDADTGKYIENFSIDVRNALPEGHADTPAPADDQQPRGGSSRTPTSSRCPPAPTTTPRRRPTSRPTTSAPAR